MRLPFPYRPEAEIVSQHLGSLSGALDWAAVAKVATPWVQAVRANPPPFWAMESLLKEYPISSAEGLALMRLAEALLRVPDAATAIALTADQLGRADFHSAGDKTLARLSSTAIAMSKKFLPDSEAPTGLLAKLGARSVVAATLRAVQLLGRQFVLGQTITEAMNEANAARRKMGNLRYSYDMLGEGARTDADALQYLASYQDAIAFIATHAAASGVCEVNDGISIKLSALHPRYEDAHTGRVLAELVPRVWGLCEQAARANINLTIDSEEVDRLELSLTVFEALVSRVAQHFPHWGGFGLAMQTYQTRSLQQIEHVIALARQYKIRLMCRLVKGAYWDAEIKRAQENGLPAYPVFTHKHHTDISYLALLFAGKTPVLVNWTAGSRSMAFGLDLLQVKQVVSVSTLINRLDAQGVDLSAVKPRLFLLDEAGKKIHLVTKLVAAFQARFNWTSLLTAQPPACAAVLFTSGSESHPKAVPLSQGNILANIRDSTEALQFREDERVMGCLPPFHAFGLTTTTILPLLAGLRVVYHPNPTEGRMLARLIEAYHATLLVGTPTFLGGILRVAEDRHLESLRVVVSGAEKCPEHIYATLARRWPRTKVLEGYGITECSPVVSVNREDAPRTGTIGRPLATVDWVIVDLDSGRRAEPGEPGMLLVKGPSIFSGYLNQDVESPFETFEGASWYRTGDLVRTEEGVLVFTGRLKRFVKLGGEMVSLPAIEEALSRRYQGEEELEPLLAVESSAEELNPDLILFSVAGILRDDANAVIRAAGLSSLHNIRVVRQINQIPTLGTGKTDYRALRALLSETSV